jgi:hypothetical protein
MESGNNSFWIEVQQFFRKKKRIKYLDSVVLVLEFAREIVLCACLALEVLEASREILVGAFEAFDVSRETLFDAFEVLELARENVLDASPFKSEFCFASSFFEYDMNVSARCH